MLRSTCDSAAKLTTTSLLSPSALTTDSESLISPRWNEYLLLGKPRKLSRLPAYVSASKTITCQFGKASSRSRTKADPIKPAPPVIKILVVDIRLLLTIYLRLPCSRFIYDYQTKSKSRTVDKGNCKQVQLCTQLRKAIANS